MARTIVPDATPLSLVSQRSGISEADSCRQWVIERRAVGDSIRAPAITYYEVARELRRSGQLRRLARLDAFCGVPGCYLALTDSALRLAVDLWAQARNAGRPTADPK